MQNQWQKFTIFVFEARSGAERHRLLRRDGVIEFSENGGEKFAERLLEIEIFPSLNRGAEFCRI